MNKLVFVLLVFIITLTGCQKSQKQVLASAKDTIGADSGTIEWLSTNDIGPSSLEAQRISFVKESNRLTVISVSIKSGHETLIVCGTVDGNQWVRGFIESSHRPKRYWFDKQILNMDQRIDEPLRKFLTDLPANFETARVISKKFF